MDSFAGLRRMMVDCQIRTYDVTDRAVLAAADELPREAFLPEAQAHLAYLDQSVPIAGTGRSLMAPMVAARMIQNLAISTGDAVLEYAGGTGYGAALMSRMGASSTLWEPDAEAFALAPASLQRAGSAEVTVTDTRPPDATFDAILVGGACDTSPERLFGLLKDGGRLIAVQGAGRSARVQLYQKSGVVVSGRPVFDAAAPMLEEFRREPAFVF